MIRMCEKCHQRKVANATKEKWQMPPKKSGISQKLSTYIGINQKETGGASVEWRENDGQNKRN
jgi:hypothetical protein